MKRKRKSPVRHHVKSHIRNGSRVTAHTRGRGTATSSTRFTKRRIIHEEGSARKSFEEYDVTFNYAGGRKEKVTVYARDMDDALNFALKARNLKLKPKSATIHDGLGAFLGKIAGKVIGGVRVGAEAYRLETTRAKEEAEKLKAQSIAERERTARKMIYRAKIGDRSAQIWCEQHNIAWEKV